MTKYKIFTEPLEIYNHMLFDIKKAKKSIYLETYIYDKDIIGYKFKQLLLKKSSEGVKIKLLIDSWGSSVKEYYFEELIKNGAEVKFFRKFKITPRLFSTNHRRNHRKLLLIDEKISYIGSVNITASCLGSLELVLRMEGGITKKFIQFFNNHYKYEDAIISRKLYRIFYEDLKIIADSISYLKRVSEKEYLSLIRKAKKEVLIMTPYFVPPAKIRKTFYNLMKKGVVVSIIVPVSSDVKLADLIRDSYLAALYNKGVQIYFYKPGFLHSKLLVVDDEYFLMGSSNVDYRSFRWQSEINVIGRNKNVINELRNEFNKTLRESVPFDYERWRLRSRFKRLLERIGEYIREYL